MSINRSADAPAAKLRRVKQGAEVGVIRLPDDHRILVDGRNTPEDTLLFVRMNQHGCLCWCKNRPKDLASNYLKQANGDITTGRDRRTCRGWPRRFWQIGGERR